MAQPFFAFFDLVVSIFAQFLQNLTVRCQTHSLSIMNVWWRFPMIQLTHTQTHAVKNNILPAVSDGSIEVLNDLQ